MSALDTLAAAMRRLAGWRPLAATGAVYVAFATAFFATSLPFAIPHVTQVCGAPPPDLRLYTSAAGVQAFLAGCGPAGRLAYQHLQQADLLYPTVFALFVASALATLLVRVTRAGSRWLAVAALPLLSSAFDYLENVAAWVALARFPARAEPASSLLGLASAAKSATSWAATILLIGLLVVVPAMAARRALARRRTTPGQVEASEANVSARAGYSPR